MQNINNEDKSFEILHKIKKYRRKAVKIKVIEDKNLQIKMTIIAS